MGLLKGLFDLADDIISVPTDLLGITNHHDKNTILSKAKQAFLDGKITASEYERIKEYCE